MHENWSRIGGWTYETNYYLTIHLYGRFGSFSNNLYDKQLFTLDISTTSMAEDVDIALC